LIVPTLKTYNEMINPSLQISIKESVVQLQ